jgi:LAO/AO transport system kinase
MDHPGAQTMVSEVRSVIALDPERERRPPILLTEALRGEGVDELWQELTQRRAALDADGRLDERRRENLRGEIVSVAVARAREQIRARLASDPRLAGLVEEVQRRETDPLSVVSVLLDEVLTSEHASDAR